MLGVWTKGSSPNFPSNIKEILAKTTSIPPTTSVCSGMWTRSGYIRPVISFSACNGICGQNKPQMDVCFAYYRQWQNNL